MVSKKDKIMTLSDYALCWNEKAFIEKEWDDRFYEQFQRDEFCESIKKRESESPSIS